MTKTCPVCGTVFDSPPSGSNTCSRTCGGVLSGKSRIGKPHRWSMDARKRWTERVDTRNLKLGTAAARRSPVSGPFETNQEAKIWHLRNTRTGDKFVVRNLRKFYRDHPALFAPSHWERAYAGLRQVQASLMGTRGKARNVSRYKDWTLTSPAEMPAKTKEQ